MDDEANQSVPPPPPPPWLSPTHPPTQPEWATTPPDLFAPAPRRRRRVWPIIGWTSLIVAVIAVWAAQLIHIPYYTEAPGDAVKVQPLVSIDGAPSYESEGSFMLLYIRKRDEITVLRYVQAWIDDDIDVERGNYDEPGNSPAEIDASSQSDMARAQFAARKLALERIGEEVKVLDGLVVTSVVNNRPAAEVLRPGDVILEVDDLVIPPGDPERVLTTTIRDRAIGDSVAITFERDGKRTTESIATVSNGGDPALPYVGLQVDVRYEYPFAIEFGGEIEGIGGPSAGLAMTLALLDELTPGELSGGVDVAVTGTIEVDGTVGNVGRVDLKAKAAARRGATLMLVPTCRDPAPADAYASPADYALAQDFKRSCDEEVARAADAIETVVEVATLDEALAALAAHGGVPVPAQTVESPRTTTTTV